MDIIQILYASVGDGAHHTTLIIWLGRQTERVQKGVNMTSLNIVYASAPSADLLIPTLEFKNEEAGVIRLIFLHNFHGYDLTDYPLFVTHLVI